MSSVSVKRQLSSGETTRVAPRASIARRRLGPDFSHPSVVARHNVPAGAVSSLDAARRRRGVWPMIAAAAAAIAVLAVGAVVLRDGPATPSFASTVSAIMATDDSSILHLDHTPEGGDAGDVNVMWSPTHGHVALVAKDLPPLDESKAYARWLVDGDGAHPVGLFRPDADRSAELIVPIPGQASQWGITVEPAAGSATPTLPMLFNTQV